MQRLIVRIRFALFTVREQCLLTVLCLMLLAGCSKSVSIAPTPSLAENLRRSCPVLPQPPEPMTDPERAIWESILIANYEVCAAMHWRTVEAWPKK